ncbi:MAG: superoxide dismutase family protein [Clostridia bacterium]|nr:superoxide dismutase family protein [Clostridia bacterium]
MQDRNPTHRPQPLAEAILKGSDKYPGIRGRVLFFPTRDGVLVRTEVTGLPKGKGLCHSPVFAFHIHSGTTCAGDPDDPFREVGSHYNPQNCPHPYHAGDLPPLFGVKGRAFSIVLTDRFALPDILGRAVILHAMPDDFTTQPAGNAGEKMACGIIRSTRKPV